MSEAHTPARPVLPTEQNDYVTLREFEQRMTEFRILLDERTRYEREILSTRENFVKEALSLQAAEYGRRLNELNHAHEGAIENWRQSLPREVFEAYLVEFRTWRDTINKSVALRADLPADVASLDKRLTVTEQALLQAQGALTLIRFMGFAGVLALIVTFLRLAKVLP